MIANGFRSIVADARSLSGAACLFAAALGLIWIIIPGLAWLSGEAF